jgi:hypothetical protein
MSYTHNKSKEVQIMLLYSKTLGKDVNFTTFEKMDDFGRPIKIIHHDSLQDVIHNLAKVKYDFNFVSSDTTHCVVICSMADASGRVIREIGESIPATLDTKIAQDYPALIASQRAFDRAAIRYLDLPGKVFSNMEISIIDGNIEETVGENPVSTTPQSGVISSIVQDDEMMSYDTSEEFAIETDAEVIVKPEMDIETDLPVVANTDINVDIDATSSPVDENVVIGDVDVEIGSSDDLPFDTETEEEDYGNHVITMSGKYSGKNKTVAEIYSTDAGWAEWIAQNFVPRNEVAKKDVAAIKNYIEKRGK